MARAIIKIGGNVKTYFTKPKTLPILSLWPLINGACVVLLSTPESKIMAKSTTPDTLENLPKNKMGGLNLNWAITQALNKFGVNAKISDVREFIAVNYGKLGKKAIENEGSLSTGLSAMRKKFRDEAGKVPPVPVNGGNVPVPQATPRPDVVPASNGNGGSTSAVFGNYVKTTLKPALVIVRKALEATDGDLVKLKQAIAEIEEAQKVFGNELPTVVAMVQ